MHNLHAIVRYWTRLVPQARRELAAWRASIETIPDPIERQVAREKVSGERQNVESAAFFALLAGNNWRLALQSVVRFQAIYELVDGLNEQQPDLQAGLALHGRLAQMANSLVLERAVHDLSQAQARHHAQVGLQGWAERFAPGLLWWEAAASGISSLRVLAMLCSAAKHHEPIRQAYVEIDALAGLLDALVDLPDDQQSGAHNWLGYYRDEQHAADRLGALAQDALAAVARLPDASIHGMLVEGLLAHNLAPTGSHAPIVRSRLAEISRLVRAGTRILRAREVLRDGFSQPLPIGNDRRAWQDEP